MSKADIPVAEQAAELRRAFDRAFAEAPRARAEGFEDLLAIRVGQDPYFLRVAEIGGLYAGKAVTELPASPPELLGIAGFRSAIVPVYDLAALLGQPRGRRQKLRWLVLAAHSVVGLAFDQFEGYVRAPRKAAAPTVEADQEASVVREVVEVEGLRRPVVHVASIVEMIGTRGLQYIRSKE